MTREHDPAMDEWVEAAKRADLLEVAQRLGAQLKKAGHELVGPCPTCGGTDRFSINTKKAVFNCRGGKGGGAVDMVMHVHGSDFIGACAFINDSDPPRGEARPVNEAYARERREERRDREISQREQESRDVQKAKTNAEKLWDRGRDIAGTPAAFYLHRRGLSLSPSQSENLKFIADLDYVGFADADTDAQTTLGAFPCMIAAIRNVGGEIIGIHRTYLDKDKGAKLVPPGDRARNAAKKIYGKAMGGAIWFGPITEAVALAEGIETALSWNALGFGEGRYSIGAAVSLGNLSGSATDSMKHPTNGKPIPNGIPDLDHPGIILPDHVVHVMILGDGDSEPVATRMRLLTAARRFKAQARTVLVHVAPEGMDWNDVLRSEAGAPA